MKPALVLGQDALAERYRALHLPAEEPPDLVIVTDGSWEEALARVARGGTILVAGASSPEVRLDTTRLHYDQITIQALEDR